MKNIFKISLLFFFLIISCQSDNDINDSPYPYSNNVGYSANDILSNNIFTDIIIEVLYVDEFKPSDEALNNFKSLIEARTYKNIIQINTRLIDISIEESYTLDAVINIEDNNRSYYSKANQLAIFVLFLNGSSSKDEENSVILGMAYRNTSFVIFEETIRLLSDSANEPNSMVLETTVIEHEFGHLLGLVDVGSPMISDHEDMENNAHCISEDCLMYYEIESVDRTRNFNYEAKIPQFDSFCLADLKANGGK